MTWKIPLFKIYWDEEDVDSVSSVIRSGMTWAVGNNVRQFENDIAAYIGKKYCLTFNSGTSALHAALHAHGIGPGDEVIVPSFTFIATANAPLFTGGKPVFSDIEEDTLGINPDCVLERINARTKAILPVHYGGCPCKIREIKEIADDHNILLIEDAAEAFGASVNELKVGSFGDSATMSFCQNKVITTGEGGAQLTDSREIYEKMKLFRSHGRLESSDYFTSYESMDYISLGYNFRLSNIAAALGISQIRKVDEIIKMRNTIAELYSRLFTKRVPEVSLLNTPDGFKSVYQLYSIRVPDRDGLMRYLSEKGIMTKIYFDPVHQTSHFRNGQGYSVSLPVTERISKEIISLPIYPGLSPGDIERVVETISNYYQEKR